MKKGSDRHNWFHNPHYITSLAQFRHDMEYMLFPSQKELSIIIPKI